MPQAEMPIFTRTFDLVVWVLPISNSFPRAQRHTVTKRLIDAVLDLRERLEEANLRLHGERQACLQMGDEALSRVRLYLRLASQLGWLTAGQYRHVAAMVSEIGRLLGGWQKATKAS